MFCSIGLFHELYQHFQINVILAKDQPNLGRSRLTSHRQSPNQGLVRKMLPECSCGKPDDSLGCKQYRLEDDCVKNRGTFGTKLNLTNPGGLRVPQSASWPTSCQREGGPTSPRSNPGVADAWTVFPSAHANDSYLPPMMTTWPKFWQCHAERGGPRFRAARL